jgi:hypothetical protein
VPLLDHFHPPRHGPRRWEGFHHAWATYIATQLNETALPLAVGTPLPEMPLWLSVDLCVPVRLEESYLATCRSLRIPA